MALHAATPDRDEGTVIQIERSIGAILVDAGRLSVADAERVLHVQREQNLRFGDAAVKLGLITETDIQLALSRQFDYPYLQRGTSSVSEEVVAAYDPFSAQVESLRTLRSQLMLRWFDGDAEKKRLAIVSPGGKEGRSFIAANLAVVFSQLGERTLLVDADMRSPTQHTLFGVENRTGLSAALAARGGPLGIQRVPGLRSLSILPAGAIPPNPIELLSQPVFKRCLAALGQAFDVILIDSPPAIAYADAQAIAARAGAALVVARKNVSRNSQLRAAAETFVQSGAVVVGSVLNDL
jgi:chain length determinant protein tyrosine kinase EpsG